MNKGAKVLVSAIVAVPLVAAGGATAYASHYRNRALPGSSVAGIDVGGMTRDEVSEALRRRAAAVQVEVSAPGQTRMATLTDLGQDVDLDASVDRVFDVNDTWSAYAKALFEARPVEVVVRSDPARLDDYVADLVAPSVRKAIDAQVLRSKDKLTFTVKPAVTGRAADPGDLPDVAGRAAKTLTSAATAVRIVDQTPDVTTQEAEEVSDKANALVRHTVRISDGSQNFTATTREKSTWVSVPVADGAPAAPVIDRARVSAWVAKSAKSAESEPRDGLRHLLSTGKLWRVVTPAEDGVRVTNAEAVAKKIVADLTAGHKGSHRFATKKVPAKWTDRRLAAGAENLAYPALAGEKWIDVNLSRHTMTAYVGGSAVNGPIKMVDGGPETPTDVGTFHIYLKNPLMTMRGQNADGTDYETPDVPWSSFFNGGEALHGAYWRESFGYSASHGCVNLPIPTAKWVYDWAPIGTPVVSHY